MRKLLLTLCTLLTVLCTSVYAIDIPKPISQSWVHDYANVIDASAEDSINALGDELDLNGYGQMVFVVVEFLDGYDVEDYAYALFNEWGIGHGDDNDGVLILVSVGDREYHLLQGKGIEKVLTSADLGEIADEELIPSLANDNYSQGLLDTAEEISARLSEYYAYSDAGNPGESTTVSTDSFSTIVVGFLVELILFLIVIAIMFALLNYVGKASRRRHYAPYYHQPHRHRPQPMIHHHRPSPSRHFSSASSSRPSRSSSSRPSRPSRSSSRSFGGGASRGGGRGGKF